jgi:hypothetical protein
MQQTELEHELEALAQRVAAIEERLGIQAATLTSGEPVEDSETAERKTADPTELLPAVGRALLGLAAAYLLRAFTESGAMPGRAGVALGIVYAMGWLVWAARTSTERRVQAALHSLTAALVLAPLLWEATLRFHAISNWTAALLLLLFTIFGMAVSWRKNLMVVATIGTFAGVGASCALLVASRDVVPYTIALLAIAAAVEASACLDHWLNERWLAAAAADLSVLLMTWLVTNPRGVPETYAPIPTAWLLAAQVALLAIYLSSIIVRTLLRRCLFTGFETAQCAAAFLISVAGGLQLSRAMAVVVAVCGAACYVVSFAMLERTGRGRNFYTYSTFGIVLALAGSRILLSGDTAAAVWIAVALACIWAGGRFRSLTLQMHGGIYLVLALIFSGALRQSAAFVLGSANWPGEEPAALTLGAAAALAAWTMATRAESQFFRTATAAVVAWLGAGIVAGLATAAYHGTFGAEASHAYCAMLRTSILSLAAMGLAWAGGHWKAAEWGHLIYPTMALGAWRLVMDDLHQDRKAALFLSLLVYGAALTMVPKLRTGRRQKAAA